VLLIFSAVFIFVSICEVIGCETRL